MGRDPTNKAKDVGKSKLSVKDEIVIQAFISGETKTGAYKKGFKTNRWKGETIHNKASKFFKRGEVSARIEELREIAEANTQITYESYMIKLETALKMSLGEIPIKKVDKAMGTITGCVEVCETDLKAFVGIGKELCTLMEWYPKTGGNGNEKPQKIEFVINGVSKDES